MKESSSSVWPILDFNIFPDNMITGLTLEGIHDYIEKDPQGETNTTGTIVDLDQMVALIFSRSQKRMQL